MLLVDDHIIRNRRKIPDTPKRSYSNPYDTFVKLLIVVALAPKGVEASGERIYDETNYQGGNLPYKRKSLWFLKINVWGLT